MRLFSFFLLASLLMVGCREPFHGTPEITNVIMEGSKEKRVAILEIEGMMCEIGCVSKVKKELLELEGVSNVFMDFDSDRETNFANVEYDIKKVSLFSIYNSVNIIADGRLYGVKAVVDTEYRPKAE
jgi:copper chaperone CopZ